MVRGRIRGRSAKKRLRLRAGELTKSHENPTHHLCLHTSLNECVPTKHRLCNAQPQKNTRTCVAPYRKQHLRVIRSEPQRERRLHLGELYRGVQLPRRDAQMEQALRVLGAVWQGGLSVGRCHGGYLDLNFFPKFAENAQMSVTNSFVVLKNSSNFSNHIIISSSLSLSLSLPLTPLTLP